MTTQRGPIGAPGQKRMEDLLPHQQRVVEERDELLERVRKLTIFTFTDKFKDLPRDEQERLRIQEHLMNALGTLLQQRIEHF